MDKNNLVGKLELALLSVNGDRHLREDVITELFLDVGNGAKEMFQLCQSGKWLEVIQLSNLFSVVSGKLETFNTDTDLYQDLEKCCLSEIKLGNAKDFQSRIACEISLLTLAVSLMNLFAQLNWTGPSLKYLNSSLNNKKLGEFLVNNFNDNRGEVSNVAESYSYLWIAAVILIKGKKNFEMMQLIDIWRVRLLYLLQEVLDDVSPILQDVFNDICTEGKLPGDIERSVAAEHYLTCMYLSLRYYNYGQAKDFLEKAKNMMKLEFSLEGALGIRTKFQEKELAQMKMTINRALTEDASRDLSYSSLDAHHLPKSVKLDSELLLPDIKYTENETIADLLPIEQACIVSTCSFLKKTKPKDSLTPEELTPYVEYVIKNPQCWSVQNKALHLRSMLECDSSRKVERALGQMEELVKCYKAEVPEARRRLELLTSVGLSPRWTYEKELGKLLISLGCTKTALDVFIRIQEWEDVIHCYRRLGSHEKAEKIIREQLQRKETPRLWCLLGSVTDDITHYEKAWELSGHKYAKAQSGLGFWYMKKGRLEDCIHHFEKSLELNYLQPSVWFALGFAAMTTKKYAVAAKAYQSAVSVDPDSFEAWSNLGSCFIRIGQKERAFRAIKETLRLNYEEWRIWENYALVATDIGEFSEVITACNRLLDLKKKHVDIEVLAILCEAVSGNVNDRHGEPASKLMPQVKKLFGRITSQVTSKSEVWSLYASLYSSSPIQEDKYKVYQYTTKALKCRIDADSWKNDPKEIDTLVKLSKRLKEVSLNLAEEKSLENERNQILTTPRLLLKNLAARLKDRYGSEFNGVAELNSYIDDVTV